MIGSFRLTQIGEFQPTRIGVFRPTQFGEFHPTRTVLLRVEVLHIGRMLLDVEIDFAFVKRDVRLQQVVHILADDLVALLLQNRLDALLEELGIWALRLAEDEFFLVIRGRIAAAACEEHRRDDSHEGNGQKLPNTRNTHHF